MIKYCYFFAFCALCLPSCTPTTITNQISIKRFSKSEMKLMVESFVKYTLFFKGIENDGVCSKRSFNNVTESTIFNNLAYCPNGNYRPRRIMRSQISWKPVDNSGKRGNYSGYNDNLSKKKGGSHANGDKVHNYLAFALLLPEHPYSTELEIAIRQVAPMFPQVSLIIGDANEFSDLSSKYLIHSYPALLFFKGGIYVGDFVDDKADVAGLAVYLSLWTRSFPKSAPNAIAVHQLLPSKNSWSGSFGLFKGPIPNLEPFLGSIHYHKEFDTTIFLAAALYCFARIIQILF